MPLLPTQFDATKIDPTQGASGLPIGKHPVKIVHSDIKATKDQTGGYIQLDLEIISGPHVGMSGPYRINYFSQSEVARTIAERQMSALSHVLQVYVWQDTAQLHNIPFMVEIGPQKDQPQYTEVKKIFDINGNEPGKAPVNGGGAAQPPAQNQAASAAPPVGAWGSIAGQQAPQPSQAQALAPAPEQPAPQPPQTAQQPQQPPAGGWVPPGGQAPQSPAQAPQSGPAPTPTPAWMQR